MQGRKVGWIGSCRIRWVALTFTACAVGGAVPSWAQEGQSPPAAQAPKAGESAGTPAEPPKSTALAKKLQNPLSDLVSVPFQFNWAQPFDPDGGSRFSLNVQPVIPMTVSERWNLIVRLIQPFVSQPPLQAGGEAASGIGDTLLSLFASPRSGQPFIWGVGPYFSLPSATEPTLGTGRWSIGPTGVVLKQSGPFTYGVLVNQAWSFAGNARRPDVSQLFLQPFVSFTTRTAVTVGLNSESIANWEAPSGARWTIPINLLVSKVATFGPFPASYGGGVGYYVETPSGDPDWQLRLVLTLLLPKRE